MNTKEQETRKITKREQIYSTKGITLIALVITIIVLIILAGVTINLTLGDNGIFNKAEQAKEDYRIAVNEESKQITNVEAAIEGIVGETTGGIPISNLEVGDYIKYNTGKTEIGDNGVVLCRVLYNDATHGLQIITDKNITQKVDGVDTAIQVTVGGSDWETGKTAYNSTIEALNNKAEEYLNTTYAYDARCVGSAPTVENGMFINKDKVKFEGTTEYVEPGTTVSIPDNYTLPTGWTSRDTGCYAADENYTDDQTAMQAEGVGIWTTGEVYLLASRYVDSSSSNCSFRVHYVRAPGQLFYYTLCYVSSDGSSYGNADATGIRPCFSLKSNIKVTGEDGKTAETAYVIE